MLVTSMQLPNETPFADIEEVIELSSATEVNEALSLGWTLLKIVESTSPGTALYVMGKLIDIDSDNERISIQTSLN